MKNNFQFRISNSLSTIKKEPYHYYKWSFDKALFFYVYSLFTRIEIVMN